jgi:hypothetical protein
MDREASHEGGMWKPGSTILPSLTDKILTPPVRRQNYDPAGVLSGVMLKIARPTLGAPLAKLQTDIIDEAHSYSCNSTLY